MKDYKKAKLYVVSQLKKIYSWHLPNKQIGHIKGMYAVLESREFETKEIKEMIDEAINNNLFHLEKRLRELNEEKNTD